MLCQFFRKTVCTGLQFQVKVTRTDLLADVCLFSLVLCILGDLFIITALLSLCLWLCFPTRSELYAVLETCRLVLDVHDFNKSLFSLPCDHADSFAEISAPILTLLVFVDSRCVLFVTKNNNCLHFLSFGLKSLALISFIKLVASVCSTLFGVFSVICL